MLDPSILQGPLFRQFLETEVGARGLMEAMLSGQFGPRSPQARTFRPQTGNMFQNYLGSFVSQSPLVQPLLGQQGFRSMSGTQSPTDFLDYMGGVDFNRMYQMMGPRERGASPRTFSPTVRRVS